VPVRAGENAELSIARLTVFAQAVEDAGYVRIWFAEHHGIASYASAAPGVLAAVIAVRTRAIRVGAGGVMLLNHSPLAIAEQFGTLEAFFPGRIDLGVGRAVGGDPFTARSLRRLRLPGVDQYRSDLTELIGQLWTTAPTASAAAAIPGRGSQVPVWVLGSSVESARLAGELGRPYSFAAHFTPDGLLQAAEAYRDAFVPSEHLRQPYLLVSFNVAVARTYDEAACRASSMQMLALAIRSGRPVPLQPPDEAFYVNLSRENRRAVDTVLRHSAVGTPHAVTEKLRSLIAETGADELILFSPIFDPEARLESYTLLARAWARSSTPQPVNTK
jgi:luciferase family oxidoreductase group 1